MITYELLEFIEDFILTEGHKRIHSHEELRNHHETQFTKHINRATKAAQSGANNVAKYHNQKARDHLAKAKHYHSLTKK